MQNWLPRTVQTVAIVGALALGGCNSGVQDVDATGPEAVKTLGEIDPRDWSRAADEMVQSLLTSSVLESAPRSPAVMGISRIRNRTGLQIDTDLLTKKIRTSLNQSGKVLTTTVIGLGGQPEDPMAAGEAQRREFFAEDEKTAPKVERPDYTLSGKIIGQETRGQKATQVTYAFQLSLTDVRTGLAVWEDERLISKKQNNPGPRLW